MAGNVSEWVYDSPYSYNVSDDEKNPSHCNMSNAKIVRGGSWYHSEDFLRTTKRLVVKIDIQSELIGFRCAKDYEIPSKNGN
jgi:formylglycine-generating enzyme required for sulfatase activity